MAWQLLKEALEHRLKDGVSYRWPGLNRFKWMQLLKQRHQFRWYRGSKVFRPIMDEGPLYFV